MDKHIIIKKYLQEHSLVESNITSFNNFIEKRMQQIVNELNESLPKEEIEIKLGKIRVEKPNIIEADGSVSQITPVEARIRNLTYSATIFLEMSVKQGNQTEGYDVEIGRIPVMVRSKICNTYGMSKEEMERNYIDPKDPGGYFLINGNERVMVLTEDLAANQTFIEKSKEKLMLRLFSSRGAYRIPLSITETSDGIIEVSFSRFKNIPSIILLKALGLLKESDVAKYISKETDSVIVNLYEFTNIATSEEAMMWIADKTALQGTKKEILDRVKQRIDNYFMPHIGTKKENRIEKAVTLCKFIKQFLIAKENPNITTDKDHYANKRVKLTGDMLADLFRVNLSILIRDIQYSLSKTMKRRKFYSLKTIAKSTLFSHRIESAIATGSWIGERTGVTQNMDKTNYLSMLSQLQRVSSILPGEQENFLARTLHPTHYGRYCVDKNTNVLLGDGITQMPIKNIANNWNTTSILSFDKNKTKFVPSKICAYHMFNPPRPTLRIETEAGRSIIATVEHPFLISANEWRDAGKLKEGEKVAIYPVIEDIDNICEEKTIIDENLVKKLYPHNAIKVIKKLKALNLFPLTTKHSKLPIIARIFGFLITDGYVGKCHTEFYCGCKEDIENLKADIKRLNIQPGKEKFEEGEINTYKGKTRRRIFTLQHRAELRPLMILLGIPVGRKNNISFRIPKWLFETGKLVQREFLAGFLGGDGPKPTCIIEKGRKGGISKVRLDNLIFSKKENLIENALEYANDLKNLFEIFGVKIVQIKEGKSYQRKDREIIKIMKIKFSTSQDNILNLTGKIGYRYCLDKQKACSYIGEYLKIRKRIISKKEDLKKKIIELAKTFKPREIAEKLNTKIKFIQNVLERKDKFKRTFRPKSEMSIYEWLEKNINDKGIVWEKIINIEPVECKDVRDFTTRENTHSFIANGFVTHNCPIETPEGTEIGLRKNLALLARISTTIFLDEKEFVGKLKGIGMKEHVDGSSYDVFFNGRFIGSVENSEEFVKKIKEERRKNVLPIELSVRLDKITNTITISTEVGRVLRSLLIVEEGKSKLTEEHEKLLQDGKINWNDLLNQGIIEYLDASEEENALVALKKEELTKEHTHLEIDAVSCLGIITSLVPYANHDHPPRLLKGSKTLKQGLGIYSANYPIKIDTDVSILHYPQKPVVKSFVYDTLNLYPAGQNLVVAIMTYEGYNLEDAIVLNKASIERGMGRSTYFRPYTSIELHYAGNLKDEICIPEKGVSGYKTEEAYRYLEDDGIIYPEAKLDEGGVVIGKTTPPKFLSEARDITIRARKDASSIIRQEEQGIIDMVFITADNEGNKIVQVRTRDIRNPELGDKFSAPHGQKGVVGLIVPEEDIPFTARGIKPDLIFNPHGIPSRMSIGYLIELLAGKVGCITGKEIDGTAFSGESIENLEQQLKNLGFRHDGKETMYNPFNGKMMKAKIFVGNMYYLKLKYMVSNKIHARSSGKVQLLTRQPIEGRARGGALRLGEMEQQALVAHGSSLLLKERYDSDKVIVYVCTKCGNLAVKDYIKNKLTCVLCGNNEAEPIEISYAFKLLLEELQGLHLLIKFELKNKYE